MILPSVWRPLVALLMVAGLASASRAADGGSLLGTPVRLQLATKDHYAAMAWYARMGFVPVKTENPRPDSVLHLTDGQVVLSVVKANLPSPVVVFRCDNLKGLKDTLDALKIPCTYDLVGPSFSELRLASPNGVYIAVRSSAKEPAWTLTGQPNVVCGRMTEWSIGAAMLGTERDWWTRLGFRIGRGGSSPYNYVIMTDGVANIGIHEQRDIPSLAITYFAPDMAERLDRLRKSGIVATEEIPGADGSVANGIFRSDDGQLLYLFQGEQ